MLTKVTLNNIFPVLSKGLHKVALLLPSLRSVLLLPIDYVNSAVIAFPFVSRHRGSGNILRGKQCDETDFAVFNVIVYAAEDIHKSRLTNGSC